MRRKTTVGEVDADVLAYTAGQDRVLDLALVEADCFGTAAHVTMLSRMPLQPPPLTPQDARAVIAEYEDNRGRGTASNCAECGESNPAGFEICWNCSRPMPRQA